MKALRYTEPYTKGPAVTRLQELGDSVGIDTGANDGIFGPQTLKAVLRIQAFLNVKVDGWCGPVTWGALLDHIDAAKSKKRIRSGRIVDISTDHSPPKRFGWIRSIAQIDSVVVHQTGCEMPQNPTGWARTNAHYGITQEGLAILINPPQYMIWHAQGLSRYSLGIEIEGNFEGVEGDSKTLWAAGGGPNNLNTDMLRAAAIIYEHMQAMFIAAETKLRHVHAHRQSYINRRADPGSEIWQRIAMPMIEASGATDGGPDFRVGSTGNGGLAIPRAWNSDYTAKY